MLLLQLMESTCLRNGNFPNTSQISQLDLYPRQVVLVKKTISSLVKWVEKEMVDKLTMNKLACQIILGRELYWKAAVI